MKNLSFEISGDSLCKANKTARSNKADKLIHASPEFIPVLMDIGDVQNAILHKLIWVMNEEYK